MAADAGPSAEAWSQLDKALAQASPAATALAASSSNQERQ